MTSVAQESIALAMQSETAPRSRSLEWGFDFDLGFLPDPDPVLRKAGIDIETYRGTLSDPHLWSLYDTRKTGLDSAKWAIEQPDGCPDNAYQIVKDTFDSLDTADFFSNVIDAPFYGMAIQEIVWEKKELWLPGKIVDRPPEWFVFKGDNNELRFLSRDHMLDGEELPPKKFLLSQYYASYQNPYGERLLSRTYWPYIFKHNSVKFWFAFLQKYGMPWPVGKVPKISDDDVRNKLLSVLTQMIQDGAAVISDDESIDFLNTSGKTDSSDVYSAMESRCNIEMSKAITGGHLGTEQTQTGSYAASETHLKKEEMRTNSDKGLVEKAANTLIRWIIDFNFGEKVTSPKFAFVEKEDIQAERAERDKKLSEQGVKFTRQYYMNTYNLEESDFDLKEDDPEPEPIPEPEKDGAGQEKEKPEFAENESFLDALDGQAASAASEKINAMINPLIALIRKAESLEDVEDILMNEYPDIDDSEYEEILYRALTASEIEGMKTA